MRSVTCAGCGLVGWADGEACKRCGRPLTLNQHAPGGAPPPPPPPRDYGAGYNYAPAQDYYGAPAKKRVGHAVASLVIGILGFFSFGIFLIGSLVGMTLGIVALKKEGSEPSVYGGRGLAIAGIVVNILALCMIVPLGIIAAIAIPNLLAARRAANEASAISILRTIHSAESTYAATTGNGSYGSLPQLVSVGLMDDKLSSGRVNGYFFTITASGNDFEVTAMPLTRTGSRSFYVSSPGVIRVAPAGRLAGASDPPLEASYGSQYGSPYDSQYDSRPRRTVSQPDFQTAPSY
jgi:type IV pilus assembly protein PilA